MMTALAKSELECVDDAGAAFGADEQLLAAAVVPGVRVFDRPTLARLAGVCAWR